MTRWPDVDHPRTPMGWQWPANLMPPVMGGWPRGTRRAASEAEEILAEAVAWWDVSKSSYRDGDRWLRNLGTVGGPLDLRLGSSVVANSNDPKFLSPDSLGYVYLTGVAGNYVVAPDEPALRIVGDVEFAFRVNVGLDQAIFTKYEGSYYGWMLKTNSNGTMRFMWCAGGVDRFVDSTGALAWGVTRWVKLTYKQDNGSGQYEIKFWYAADSETEPTSWTQLGTTKSAAAVANTAHGTRPFAVGAYIANTALWPMVGQAYRAIVRDGIAGIAVLDIDCDAITSGSATTFLAGTAQTVTIARAASGRKTVAMPAARLGGRACMLLGADDYLEIPSERVEQHSLLNFRAGDPFTVIVVGRQWTTTTSQGLITKQTLGTGTGAGWAIWSNTNTVYFTRADGTTAFDRVGTRNAGVTGMFSSVDNAQTRVGLIGTTSSAPLSVNGMREATNSVPLRVGAATSPTVYADAELRGAAVFRRALTARELKVINDYYATGA